MAAVFHALPPPPPTLHSAKRKRERPERVKEGDSEVYCHVNACYSHTLCWLELLRCQRASSFDYFSVIDSESSNQMLFRGRARSQAANRVHILLCASVHGASVSITDVTQHIPAWQDPVWKNPFGRNSIFLFSLNWQRYIYHSRPKDLCVVSEVLALFYLQLWNIYFLQR